MSGFGSRHEPSVLAITADLADSRRIADRAELQERLHAVLAELNRRYESSLAAPLAITRGDELQGLLEEPEATVDLIVHLSETLQPVGIRFGLGRGALSTPLRADVGRLDGPAFHRARAALERASQESRWVVCSGFGESVDNVLNTLFVLMQAIRDRWTERQLRYVRRTRNTLQKEVARHFGVSPSTVSESLKSASYSVIREAEAVTRRLLQEFGSDGESGPDSVAPPKSSPPRDSV